MLTYGAFYAWVSSTIQHPGKRAVAIAFINTIGQLANIPSSYIWPERWGPTYRISYAISVACTILAMVMNYILRAHLARENKRFEEAERHAGQERKGFRYAL